MDVAEASTSDKSPKWWAQSLKLELLQNRSYQYLTNHKANIHYHEIT